MVEHTFIPILRRQKQADLCVFKASVVYEENLGQPVYQDETLSKNKIQNTNTTLSIHMKTSDNFSEKV